jgi:phospholipid/cholesterol/gamma-HCH transport system substrate-binding protein
MRVGVSRLRQASKALKRENVNYFLVGLVTLAAIGLLLGSLWMITGRSGAVDRYVVHYRNVSGLGYGTVVFYQGYRLGQVDAITPEQKDGKTRFRVDFSITRGWRVPDDSVAMQLSSGLLADVFIGITEGESSVALVPGSEIVGREGGDVFAAVSELAGNVSDLTRNKLTPLVERLGKSVDAVSGTLESGAPALVQDALELLQRLNAGADSLNLVLGPNNRDNLAGILSNTDDAAGNISRLTDELRSSGAKLDQLIEGLRDTAAENRPDITDAIGD